MTQPWLNTPRAILIASVVMAGGLFLGLLLQEPNPASRHRHNVEAISPSAPVLPADAGPLRSRTTQRRVPKSESERSARAALEAKHQKFVEKCWRPFFKQNPDPPVAKYVIQMNFDAEGRQIGMSVSDVRGFVREETGACLQEQLLDFEIPPPGEPVSVKVKLSLPE